MGALAGVLTRTLGPPATRHAAGAPKCRLSGTAPSSRIVFAAGRTAGPTVLSSAGRAARNSRTRPRDRAAGPPRPQPAAHIESSAGHRAAVSAKPDTGRAGAGAWCDWQRSHCASGARPTC